MTRGARPWAMVIAVVGLMLWPALTGARAATATGVAQAPYQGLALAEALHRLQADGLRVVFSTDLVESKMRVEAEPRSRWPRDVLDELLEPHGLEARTGPGGVLIVVKAPPRGRLIGVVRDEHTSRPLAGVRVRVVGTGTETRTDDGGWFRIGRLPIGSYTVEASHDGYISRTLEDISVAERRNTELRIALASQNAGRDCSKNTTN